MARYVGAIDAGTTSSRFMVFDRMGTVIAREQKEHRQILPQPGWVEHDALEIWTNIKELIGSCLEKNHISAIDLAALGITNQRETTVLWDKKTGLPVHHALVWQDTRTERLCNEWIQQNLSTLVTEKTGLKISSYFSAPKLSWLFKQYPELYGRANKGELLFGTIDSWVIWNLNGGTHVTDVTNASRTMLMNLKTLEWDNELLALFGIPREVLPRILPSSHQFGFGKTMSDGPFKAEVPISGVLGDQQAALFGQGCFEPGEAKNTYGTGCFLLLNTGEEIVKSENGLLTTVAYQLGQNKPIYALEGSVAYAGACLDWLKNNLGILSHSSQSEEMAKQVKDNGGCTFVPAFSGLFAPYWRSEARGTIVGLTGFTNKNHIVRAALEAIAFQTHDVISAMMKDAGMIQSGRRIARLSVDGGASANNFLMQFQADLLNCQVQRPKMLESTCLGAAFVAGLAVDFWKSAQELKKITGSELTWQPTMPGGEREKLLAQWQKALRQVLA